MTTIQRKSPVSFVAHPAKTETRNHWAVVLEYENEGDGPWLVDISHRSKLDLQDHDISKYKPFDIAVPDTPGACTFQSGFLINRMNRTQASIWHLSGDTPEPPEDSAYTDTTEATVLLTMTGNNVFAITEKLTNLDLTDPKLKTPFLLQGPFCHVPCQVVVFNRDGLNGTVLLTCARGYAHDMAHAIFGAGEEFGLHAAGEDLFLRCLAEI